MRRLTTTILLLGFAVHAHLSSADDPKHPNVVIIMSDDMGWDDVGYHGSQIETPNIDLLAKEGVELDRFYVQHICSPTRTALMTGRSPARFGILNPLGGTGGVPLDEHFLSQSFQTAGYQTAIIGKWHLGLETEAYRPLSRGFDHFYGHLNGSIDYYEHTHQGKHDWQRNGESLEEEGYSTELFAAEAVKWIGERDKDRPLFLYLPFNAPHGPSQAPADLVAKYEAKGIDRRRTVFAASVESMDIAIGKVLTKLQEENISDNTIVLFFCDNGPKTRERAGGTLSGGKGMVSEGGIRVPAVMRWPAGLAAGKSELPISVMDLLPTLTSAAGVPLGSEKPLDGIDLWAALRDGKVVEREPFVIVGSRGAMAVFDFPLKLVTESGENTLYDIAADPSESKDLAADQPEEVQRLLAVAEPFSNFSANRRKGGKKKEKGKKRRES